MRQKTYGFTIVELLIVIVVIAVLAAITVVAFNGIKQQANNSATISSASQVIKLVNSYIGSNGSYPTTDAGGCLTPPSSTTCSSGTPNNNGSLTTAITALSAIGKLPQSVPQFDANYNGIIYTYFASRTFNGTAAPVLIRYYLQGSNQDCLAPGPLTDSINATLVTAPQKYTSSTGNVTTCSISIAGPAS